MSERNLAPQRARDWRFDLVRVVACVLVIVAHTTGQFQSEAQPTFEGIVAVVAHCLAHASVPLFFMTAGYFALRNLRSSTEIGRFWRKRLRRIWIPTLFWSLVYLTLYFAMKSADGGWRAIDWSKLFRNWFWNGKPGAGYHLWFLYALIVLELIAPWHAIWRRRRRRAADLTLLFIYIAIAVYTFKSGGDRSAIFIGALAVGYLPWYCVGAYSGVLLASERVEELARGQSALANLFHENKFKAQERVVEADLSARILPTQSKRPFPTVGNALLLTTIILAGIGYCFAFGGGREIVYMVILAATFAPFLLRIALSGALTSIRANDPRRELAATAIFAAILGLAAMTATSYFVGYDYARSDFLPPCVLLALGLWFYALTRPEKIAPKLGAILEKLAALTYGIYVAHIAVLAVLTRATSRAFPDASPNVWGAFALSALTFVVSACVAALVKRIPFLRKMI